MILRNVSSSFTRTAAFSPGIQHMARGHAHVLPWSPDDDAATLDDTETPQSSGPFQTAVAILGEDII